MSSMSLHSEPQAGCQLSVVHRSDGVHKDATPLMAMHHITLCMVLTQPGQRSVCSLLKGQRLCNFWLKVLLLQTGGVDDATMAVAHCVIAGLVDICYWDQRDLQRHAQSNFYAGEKGKLLYECCTTEAGHGKALHCRLPEQCLWLQLHG